MSRATWKGPYMETEFLKLINAEKKQYQTFPISRKFEIVPSFLGLTFSVHNGKSYIKVIVTENMIGHKFGEFSFTRVNFTFKSKNKKK